MKRETSQGQSPALKPLLIVCVNFILQSQLLDVNEQCQYCHLRLFLFNLEEVAINWVPLDVIRKLFLACFEAFA